MSGVQTENHGGRVDEGLLILVVDDSSEDRELYRRLLSGPDSGRFRLREADSAEAGLEMFRDERPDCVLLDYCLPGHDGLDFLAALRGTHGYTPAPVVMLTGQGAPAIDNAAHRVGAQEYVDKKCITRPVLEDAIRKAVSSYRGAVPAHRRRRPPSLA